MRYSANSLISNLIYPAITTSGLTLANCERDLSKARTTHPPPHLSEESKCHYAGLYSHPA